MAIAKHSRKAGEELSWESNVFVSPTLPIWYFGFWLWVWLFAFHLALFLLFPSFACMPLHHLPSTAILQQRCPEEQADPASSSCAATHTVSHCITKHQEVHGAACSMNRWSREHIHGDGLTASCVLQTPSNPIFCRKLSARDIPTSA